MKRIEGSTLGRYELRRRVAQGEMSEVYLGYDRRVRRRIAIKVLYGGDKPFVRRFEREALAVGTLSHDHILPLYDFGEQRPWYYLVMPYIEGGTLRDYLFKRGCLTLEEAGKFLTQIASALQYAHDHGVIHRDVKPSNILLRPDGYIYLVDFGLAHAKLEGESSSHTGGTMAGTPEYMAPEQSNGISDYRSDIYSLGIMLYQMLTGHVPFTADSPVGIFLKHIQTQPLLPSQFNNAIPPAIEKVILKALAKDPNERYQQANAFSAAYSKALQQIFHDVSVKRSTPIPLVSLVPFTGQRMLDEGKETPLVTMTQVFQSSEQVASLAVKMKSQRVPPSNEFPFRPAPPGIYNPRQPIYQVVLIVLCLFLLGLSITMGLLWQVQHHSNISFSHGPMSQWMTATASTHMRSQATLALQARAQAAAGITSSIGVGKLLYSDTLTRAVDSWINDGSQCYFSPQGYHVYTSLTHAVVWCYTNQRQFSNVIITAQAQLVRGDIYGLVFRLRPADKAFYVLELNYNGEYRLVRALGSNPLNWLILIDWTASTAIVSGYGHINTFLVTTMGSHFRFYINKQLIIPAFLDTTYATGLIGFLVGGDSNGGTEAIFSNIWVFQKT